MNRTKIEWVKNPDGSQGYTFNPITGCRNHTPEGLCLGGMFPCYAFRLANGRLRGIYTANRDIAVKDSTPYGIDIISQDPFYPRFWPGKLENIYRPKLSKAKPRGIFVCDMSDLFGIGVPGEWTQRVMNAIRANTVDRFYLLTKQPQNLVKFSPFPDNCWVGVTATNQKAHNEAVVVLSSIKASIKFISHEPLLEHISLHSPYSPEDAYDWDIIGAQTGPYKPPQIEWIKEIVKAADGVGILVFLKDNLFPLFRGNGIYWLRQEMPRVR